MKGLGLHKLAFMMKNHLAGKFPTKFNSPNISEYEPVMHIDDIITREKHLRIGTPSRNGLCSRSGI